MVANSLGQLDMKLRTSSEAIGCMTRIQRKQRINTMEALLHHESQCGRRSLFESHLTTYCLILYRWQSFIDATQVTSAVEQAFARPRPRLSSLVNQTPTRPSAILYVRWHQYIKMEGRKRSGLRDYVCVVRYWIITHFAIAIVPRHWGHLLERV